MKGKIILGSALVFLTACSVEENETVMVEDMTCDRSCLIDVLDAYVDAVIANRPGGTVLTGNYRGTENALDVAPGAGFWATSSSMGNMGHYYADPVNQTAAFYGIIKEGNNQTIASVRLKIEDRAISEAEWVIARAGEALVNFEGLLASQPVVRRLPQSQWSTRESMMTAADSYFHALQAQDPDFVVPHVTGCPRIENGTMVTGAAGPAPEGEEAVEFGRGDCASGLERMTQISGVEERIFPVVDQEAGVVLGRGVFSRPPGAARRDGTLWPRNYLMEYFSVDAGEVSGIYAAMHYLPADSTGTNW